MRGRKRLSDCQNNIWMAVSVWTLLKINKYLVTQIGSKSNIYWLHRIKAESMLKCQNEYFSNHPLNFSFARLFSSKLNSLVSERGINIIKFHRKMLSCWVCKINKNNKKYGRFWCDKEEKSENVGGSTRDH